MRLQTRLSKLETARGRQPCPTCAGRKVVCVVTEGENPPPWPAMCPACNQRVTTRRIVVVLPRVRAASRNRSLKGVCQPDVVRSRQATGLDDPVP